MAGIKEKKKTGLKKAFGCLVIILVFVSVLVDCYALFRYTYKHGYEVRLKETGRQTAGTVRQNMENAVTFVRAAATVFGEFGDLHCEEALRRMEGISAESNFTRMWLTKADGSAVSSEGNTSDATGRAYLEDGLEGGSGISEVQFSRVNGEMNVAVYAPVFHGDAVSGLVIGIYRLDQMLDVIDIQCFGDSGYCSLVRENGEVIVDGGASDWDGSKTYSYLCPVGVNDWQVYIRVPREILVDDLKAQGFLCALMCLKLLFIVLYFVIDKFRMGRNALVKMAQTDSMTELWNRKAIEEKINGFLAGSPDAKQMLIVLDVDRFKKVNDTEGHLAGDVLIRRIAEALEEAFGAIGLVSRLGGDEFAVFIPSAVTDGEIRERVERLFERIEKIAPCENWKQPVSVSMGVAAAPADGTDFEGLYRAADARMYDAKGKKGNSIRYEP